MSDRPDQPIATADGTDAAASHSGTGLSGASRIRKATELGGQPNSYFGLCPDHSRRGCPFSRAVCAMWGEHNVNTSLL
ncbi:MAG TPA: hypothetical protein VH196_07175, partial [Terriglobales bacterium]|nr:hypothetical protein [Terriglobales bacterium]